MDPTLGDYLSAAGAELSATFQDNPWGLVVLGGIALVLFIVPVASRKRSKR
jgi:hypothetical protein